jgi:hypothetical protein
MKLYGQKLELDKVKDDITALAKQSKTITEIVVQGDSEKSEKIKRLLQLINSSAGGISTKEIPEEFKDILPEVLSLAAIKSKFDKEKNKVIFNLTPLGNKIISGN